MFAIMTKDEARQEIANIVTKYQNWAPAAIKAANEASTINGFIRPVFTALGWDFCDTNEVSPEHTASGGRVDFAFRLNGVSQFFLEAKKFSVDLNDPAFIKQAVTYAYNKGVTWAVLTDFQGTRLYNANTGKGWLFLDWDKYTNEHFEKLWLLSKVSVQSGLLAAEAKANNALPPSIPVEEKLFKQLRTWREVLYKDLHHYNDQLTWEQVDEVIQRLFNRLIFIRTAEDRGIEEKRLRAAAHLPPNKEQLLKTLRDIFRYFDDNYDSELFELHLSDNVYITDDSLRDIFAGLYEIPGGIAEYDFAVIDADVLGAVYEQYLGYVAEIVLQRAKEAQARLALGYVDEVQIEVTAKKQRRKEHGIYYTPKFVTDYIVKETVGRYLKEHTYNENRSIKILDPACGSGSFLIRAFDRLLNYHAKENNKSAAELSQFERLRILTANVHGVDLDRQAVEIARLNLLLRSLAKRELLPGLKDNIKPGNSLISGTEEELEGYFGEGSRNKRFNWDEEFKDVMTKGGFDVIIGNPPWGGDIDKELTYFHDKYPRVTKEHTEIFKLFIEASLRLVRENGLLSLIVPNTLLRQNRFKDVRSVLLQNQILTLVNLGENVFKGVIAPSCIFVIRKAKPEKDHRVFILDITKVESDAKVSALKDPKLQNDFYEQNAFCQNPDLEFIKMPSLSHIPVSLIGAFRPLICKDAGINYQRVNVGMRVKGNSDLSNRLMYEGTRERDVDIEFWKGSDIARYWIAESTSRYCRPDFDRYILDNEVVHLNANVFRITPKILIRQTADRSLQHLTIVVYGLGAVLLLSSLKKRQIIDKNTFLDY